MITAAKYHVTIYHADGEKSHVGPFTKEQIYSVVLPQSKAKKQCIGIFEDVHGDGSDLQDVSYSFKR